MNKYLIGLLVVAMLVVGFASYAKTGKAVASTSGSIADQHRKDASNFVQELQKIAGKDRNISSEIRSVANEQSEVASKSAEALGSIEKRNSLVTFLLGTDYKRIGTLRSGLVTAQNEIKRLTKAMDRTKDATVKADLQKQIDALKAIVAKTEQFIKDNESKFSVLGWAVKLFVGK